MKQKIFEVGKKAYTFNQARYEEDMGRCVITAVSERYITDDITVDTKIGKIYAKTVPGSFPGILIECETSNTAGTPGALLEYDETKKKMMLRVYGIQNPYGNPIESYEMSK